MIKIIHTVKKYSLQFCFVALFACLGNTLYNENPAYANTKVQVVKCYPNPATSFVNFEFPKNIDKNYVLQIYSFVGKKMIEVPVSESKLTVTLTDFYRGVYVFQLRNNGGQTIESGKFQVIK